jgi:hypothetical protein
MSGWTSIASALRSPSWTPPVPAAQPQPGHDPATLIPVLGALAPGTPVAGAGRSRHRRGPDPVDWSRAGLAGQPRAAAHPRAILQDCCGLLDAPWRPRSPGWNGKSMRWPSPTHGQARMALPGVGRLTARTLVAELGDLGRFPTAPSGAPGPGCPSGAQLRPQARPWPHHQAGSPWVRPILQAAAPTPTPAHGRRRLRRPGPPSGQPHRHHRDHPPVAGPLLPHPHPSLAPAPKKAGPGRVRVCACAGNTAVDRPAQPGSGLPVMRTPPSGPDGCRRANSDPPSGPSPPSRSAIGHSHRPTSRPVPPRPTTRPSPIGAETFGRLGLPPPRCPAHRTESASPPAAQAMGPLLS